MKVKRLNRNAVRSTEKPERTVTTLSEKELRSVVAGEEGCNCAYKYADSTVLVGDS